MLLAAAVGPRIITTNAPMEKNVWKSAPPSDAGLVLSVAAMPPMEHMRSEMVRLSAKTIHGVRASRADWRISRIQMAFGSRNDPREADQKRVEATGCGGGHLTAPLLW